jgi:hypothetical protein
VLQLVSSPRSDSMYYVDLQQGKYSVSVWEREEGDKDRCSAQTERLRRKADLSSRRRETPLPSSDKGDTQMLIVWIHILTINITNFGCRS